MKRNYWLAMDYADYLTAVVGKNMKLMDKLLKEMDSIDGLEGAEPLYNSLFNEEAEISDLTDKIIKEIERIRIFLIQIETGAKL